MNGGLAVAKKVEKKEMIKGGILMKQSRMASPLQ